MNQVLVPSSKQWMSVLSALLLAPPESQVAVDAAGRVRNASREDFAALVALAHTNHVIVRSMEIIRRDCERAGDAERAAWAAEK